MTAFVHDVIVFVFVVVAIPVITHEMWQGYKRFRGAEMIFSSTRPMTAPERLAAWYEKAANLGIIATGPRWACWRDYAYGAYERSETGVYRERF